MEGARGRSADEGDEGLLSAGSGRRFSSLACTMKLCVVALDYDGTIARDGRVEPLVLEAVKEAQARGIVMILVTGRIMADLCRALPEYELFDV